MASETWSMIMPWGLETHPFSSIKRICEWEEMYSTVGVRAPIWRRTMLLNRCTTSFFPFGEQRVINKRANNKCVVSAQSNISYSKTEVVVFQTFPKQWYAPQNQSSVGLLWGKWGGWCCRALEPVEPLPQSEAPCLQCHTAPLSTTQDFLILPLQPTGKTVSFSDSVTVHNLLKHLHRDVDLKKDQPFHISCFQMAPASPSMLHAPSDSSQSLQGSSETSQKGMAWF